MTTKHNIELIKTATHLELTYRDGKFKQLKHLRGTLNQPMLDALGKITPRLEIELEAFKEKWKGKVVYTSEVKKVVSLYGQFNKAWFAFFRKENNIEPKFTASDGAALKQIITYLKKINNEDEVAAIANWNLLLFNWNTLSEFHQKQIDLKYINSKLNVIIREIIKNNGGNAAGGHGSVSI